MTLSDATTPSQSGPGSDGNEVVLTREGFQSNLQTIIPPKTPEFIKLFASMWHKTVASIK